MESGGFQDRITVGLASYNRPALLRRAIASIRAQSYPDLEILVSDNGSTDPEVAEVINEFAQTDTRVRCFFHPQNRGGFFSFRFLLEQAKGQYFIWLADDDYWCEGYLTSLMAAARESGAALTYGRAVVVDVELPNDDVVAKEMPTSRNNFRSLLRFLAFDSDSVFYGLYRTDTGQRLIAFLREWSLPEGLLARNPFLAYNFPSYVFIYGLLASGGFCNASCEQTTHFVGGRASLHKPPPLGMRHLALLFAYILIHMQMLARFGRAALAVRSATGVALAPIAAGYLFVRRMGIILRQRLNRAAKRQAAPL